MLLNEANIWLENEINQEQLDQIHALYCLLDLDKKDFCKIVDAVGVGKLIEKQERYKYLDEAERELTARNQYLQQRQRLEKLKEEQSYLHQLIIDYECKNNIF